MKYIKTYESKFLIVTNGEVDDFIDRYKYYIIKIINILYETGKLRAEVKYYFKYNDKHNYGTMNNTFYLNYNNINVVYEAHRLKDCISMLSILDDTNKFNI